MNYSNIFVNDGISYADYRSLIDQELKSGRTTGGDHSPDMLHYTKMNVQRMNRVDKTVQLTAGLTEVLAQVRGNYQILVVTEGWCGDAAQIVPVLPKIVAAFPDKFELKFVLRDQHHSLIDAHLTNGGRAIPAVLVIDETGELVFKWGPRPQVLQNLLKGWKAEATDMKVIAEQLHGWYAKDKTLTTQHELEKAFSNLD
ncbi:thioredoxin family protein [Pedobacter duraquae]|uniref:Thiol-disulfide isomerase/thioredoxin n=1 Tax=Pedobacter duraquae TaxID=425511 RepID=A0A4R6IH65_9SPHI|nr:thioredoxin family protein [Pedobacter duraquae]TDO21504.1 thiol-disulfide isomerase/thioredoxin [Pedobacter duraquae]